MSRGRRRQRRDDRVGRGAGRYGVIGEFMHDRRVGVCYLEGKDISATVVAAGLARDCPRFSGGRYQQAEAQVAAAGATIGRTYRLPGYCRAR